MFKKLRILFAIFGCLLLSSCDSQRASNISVDTTNAQTKFQVGEAFTFKGLEVKILSTQETAPYFSCSIKNGYVFTKDDLGEHEVTVTYQQNKAYYNIKVYEMSEMEITSLPNKVSYKIGETFSSSGLEVVNKKTKEKISNFTLSIEENAVFNISGTFSVIISSDEYISTSFDINVSLIGDLLVKQKPNKTTYKIGDTFSSEGLIVWDGANTITDYTLSIKDGDAFKYVGTINIEVTKFGYGSTNFEVKVQDSGRDTPSGNKSLNIYYLNDTHGCFIRDESNSEAGMAYISSYLKYKKSVENCIFLSGGDMMQGGVESNYTHGIIMIDAMNEIGFSAMTIGNHDFDWGEQYLIEAANEANFPFLACNIFYSKDYQRPSYCTPYTVVEQGDIRVGVVGFVQNSLGSSIDGTISKSFSFPSPTNYVLKYTEEVRMNANCDIVVAVGHDGGFGNGYDSTYEPWLEKSPTTGEPYVDGLFFAHEHDRVSGKKGTYSTPYIQSSCNGKYIGYIDYTFEGNGTNYVVKSSTPGNIYSLSACKTEDEDVADLTNKYSEVLKDAYKTICTFKTSYTRDEFARLICEAMLWFVNNNKSIFGNLTFYMATHNIARSTVSSGAFTYADLEKALPFNNTLYTQKCTASQVKSMQQNSKLYYMTTGTANYVGGTVDCITISYIAEYSSSTQQSKKEYKDFTSKSCLISYLTNVIGL